MGAGALRNPPDFSIPGLVATGGYVPGTYTGAFWTSSPSASPSSSMIASTVSSHT